MPIRPFLAGQALEPEARNDMREIRDGIDNPATRVVAQKIIELAQRGVRDAPTITDVTLKELKRYLPYA